VRERAVELRDTTFRLLNRYSFGFAMVLALGLLAANLYQNTNFGPTAQLGTFAPVAIATMASAPAIISGNGGFDFSISPVMILISGIYVIYLGPNGLGGAVAVPILLAMGATCGMINGLLVTRLRLAPMVVTLAAWFFYTGLNLQVINQPVYGSPTWITNLAGSVGPIPGGLFTIGTPLLVWFLLGRIPFKQILMGVGSSDATAFSSGVSVDRIRVAAYALGGMFAGIGGIAVVALSNSASAGLSTSYSLPAIAGVVMGGTSLWGGRGGLIGPLFGAASIYLLSDLLVSFNVNPSWLSVMYGGMLLVAVVLLGTVAKATQGKIP
jgi:ribose transport system permease protein